MPAPPRLSVILPVADGAEYLDRTLAALRSSSHQAFEILAVDDASRDGSAARCRALGIDVLPLPARRGPAAARNAGAAATSGEILVFVDADVAVHADALERIARRFAAEPRLDALFGSYDAEPAAAGTISRYLNLRHHHVHQTSGGEALTFWAGLGAVRRAAFEGVGGFDAERYPRPSIEDIELGRRLARSGERIRLDPAIQGRHLKRWTWTEWLRTDLLRRALPWSRLVLEEGAGIPAALNLKVSERASALAVAAALPALAAAAAAPLLLAPAAIGLGLMAFWNRGLLRLFYRRGGALFAVQGYALHALYYLYGGVAFGAAWLAHGARAVAAAPPTR